MLVRHAKAQASGYERDFDRGLTQRGQGDAQLLAQYLASSKSPVDMILASSALRTRQTAQILAGAWENRKTTLEFRESLYLADLAQLWDCLLQLDDSLESVMLVGHNPALTDFFNDLCATARLDNMPTCCVAELIIDISSWSDLEFGKAELQEIDYPKKEQ